MIPQQINFQAESIPESSFLQLTEDGGFRFVWCEEPLSLFYVSKQKESLQKILYLSNAEAQSLGIRGMHFLWERLRSMLMTLKFLSKEDVHEFMQVRII